MPLTALDCKNATPRPDGKPTSLYDASGLRLLVSASGAKSWQYRYKINGKEKVYTIGQYPDVSLKEARAKRDELKRKVLQGVDPKAEQQASERAAAIAAENTFAALAEEWLEIKATEWAPGHLVGVRRSLETYLFPKLGKRPVSEIAPMELLAVLRAPAKAGMLQTAKKLRERACSIFRLAVITGRCKYNPAADLSAALPPPVQTPRASLPYQEMKPYMKRVDEDKTTTRQTKILLKLLALLGTRIGETTQTKWAHFDLDDKTWTIPPEIRKIRHKFKPTSAPHVIPLPDQAVALLRELHALTGQCEHAFPNRMSSKRPMARNTTDRALDRLGFDGVTLPKVDTHGFRSTLSTWANEHGFNPDAVERHLSHAERNQVRAAYNRARYMTERAQILQAWADWLDGNAIDRKVIELKTA